MAAIGGIILAANVNSVDTNFGGGTLLLDAIAAAVIGGTSLFGGRGEVRNAFIGALVIATVANGLNTAGYTHRDDLHRHRHHPPARRHARHDRAPAADSLRPLRRHGQDLVGGDVGQARRPCRPASGRRAPSACSSCRGRSGRADPRTRGSCSRPGSRGRGGAVGQHGGHDRAGREPRQTHLEPVARRAGVVQQDQLAADRVDRDVDAPVVVVVGGGQTLGR